MRDGTAMTLREFDELARMRDELLVQAHRFRPAARLRWRDSEQRWQHLQEQAHRLAAAADRTRAELGGAAGYLAASLRDSYVELRDSLRG